MNKCLLITYLFVFSFCQISAQIGGENTYEFLNLPTSARSTALGGTQIAVQDSDGSLALENPALYNETMHNYLSFGTVAYFAGINHGHIAYSRHVDSVATFGVAAQYVSYGQFRHTNELGQDLGTFSGNEVAINFGGARKYKRFSYGANLKIIASRLENYSSFGVAADLGASYFDEEKNLTFGFVIKNIGTQLTTYADLKEDLPFDVQFGVSKRLEHLPFRLSVIAHHLHRWDIRYNDPNAQAVSIFEDQQAKEKRYFSDKLFRHLNFNGEFYLGKALTARIGYNHLRRQELSLSMRRTMGGFSFGLGLQIKRFQLNYGSAIYHAAGGTHHFSFAFKL